MISSRVCELCNPRDSRAMRALESLTPNGSEFVNDPEACVAFVRERLAYVIEIAKERNKLKQELEKAKERTTQLENILKNIEHSVQCIREVMP